MSEDWGEEYTKLADSYAIKCKEVRELKEKNKQIRADAIDECIEMLEHDCFLSGTASKVLIHHFEQLKEQNSIIDSLKPKCSNEMPKDIVCNCTEDHKIYYRETEDEFEELDIEEHDKYIRAEVIDEVERELLANGFIFTEHALEVWHGIAEQLKEQK